MDDEHLSGYVKNADFIVFGICLLYNKNEVNLERQKKNEIRKEEMVLENLAIYRQRTRGFMFDSLPLAGPFETNPGLWKKVNEKGLFVPFSGDTVVFQLDDAVRSRVKDLQSILYEHCGNMLAEPLDPETFHVTLHDLSNGTAGYELEQQMAKNRESAGRILRLIQMEATLPLRMRMVSVFNMVSMSVVLGLEPVDDLTCTRLMELYERLQTVAALDYPLTLHITLGYYRPGRYSAEERWKLMDTFAQLNREMDQEFYLNENRLLYQRFEDMNHYYHI